jgi:UDP:flavonoid glycosyltransferase YjiC (YdhE family)
VTSDSVYEATYAGVPQVILAMWYDLYTLASRVETLGHGIFANRGFETSIDTKRLTDALVCLLLVDDARGLLIQARARGLAESCKKFGGDERAADIIWRAATGQSLAFCTTQ